MPPKTSIRSWNRRGGAAALGLSLLLAACGKAPKPADNVGPKMKAGAAKAAPTPAESLLSKSNIFISYFSTNEPRDPFNPKARPKQAPTVMSAAAEKKMEQDSLVLALQNGFAGVYGGSGTYFAVVNDEILEVKKDTILSLVVNGERKRLKVRPLKILPGVAELSVEGVAQPVIVRAGRK